MPSEIKTIPKSAEHLRIEALVQQFPAGTRKGDDARARLMEIERNRERDLQQNAGKGQFIRATQTKPAPIKPPRRIYKGK